MKTIKYLSIFAALVLISCAKEEAEQVQEGPAASYVCFDASAEAPTKLNLDAFPTVTWEYTDVVKVFSGTSSGQFTPQAGTINGSNVVLEGTIALSGTSYAVYPTSAAVSCTSGVVSAILPATQYVEAGENMDHEALLAAAASANHSFQFKNICSLVKVSITGEDVTGIVIEGKNGEYLSGKVNVAFPAEGEPTITVVEGQKFVELRPADFTTFAPGNYYIPVLPASLTGGISVGVRKAGCNEYTIGTTTEFNLVRNGGRVFSNIDVTAAGKTPALIARQIVDIAELAPLGKSFVLGNDIDVKSQTISGYEFSGTLDGQGHNIYNCIVEDGVKACLFTNVTGTSVIKNVKFGTKNGTVYDGVSKINCKTTASAVYTGLVGTVADGANLQMQAVENFAPVSITKNTTGPSNTYASGICAYATGGVNFTDVKNHGNITNKTTGAIFAGAILSNTVTADSVRFVRCENNGQIKCDAATSGSTYLGGFVAKAVKAGNVLKFTDCTNNGYIYNSNGEGTVYVAGFVGNAGTGAKPTADGRTIFINCVNNGKVHNKTNKGMRLGGFVGSLYGKFTATNCQNNGPIQADKATTDTRIGGFMGGNTASGTAYTAVLTNCVNNATATITVTGGIKSFNAYVGGFVGNNSPEYQFNNCETYGDISIANGGFTSAESYAGAFVGKGGNATATGGKANLSINVATSTKRRCGMLFASGATFKATKVGLAGTVNGTVLTADNWTSNLYGYSSNATGIITSGDNACYLLSLTQTPVTVGTFNLWSPNSRKGDISDGKAGEPRQWYNSVGIIAQTISSMDCDLIAFNEIDAGVLNHASLEAEQQLIAQVNALNSNKYTWQMEFSSHTDGTIHSNSFCNGFAYDATKLEIVEAPVRVWLQSAQTSVTSTPIDGGRTLVYVKFKEKSSNKVFWFAVTHLSLGDDMGTSWYNASGCVNWAKATAAHNTPCILCGDMNCATVTTRPSTMAKLNTYWVDAYVKAKAAGVLDADNQSKPATRPGTSKVGTGTATELGYLTKEENRYDHIMVDLASVSAYTCIRDLYDIEGTNYWPSDHFPIKATIQL